MEFISEPDWRGHLASLLRTEIRRSKSLGGHGSLVPSLEQDIEATIDRIKEHINGYHRSKDPPKSAPPSKLVGRNHKEARALRKAGAILMDQLERKSPAMMVVRLAYGDDHPPRPFSEAKTGGLIRETARLLDFLADETEAPPSALDRLAEMAESAAKPALIEALVLEWCMATGVSPADAKVGNESDSAMVGFIEAAVQDVEGRPAIDKVSDRTLRRLAGAALAGLRSRLS